MRNGFSNSSRVAIGLLNSRKKDTTTDFPTTHSDFLLSDKKCLGKRRFLPIAAQVLLSRRH